MSLYILHVKGMHCAACEMLVEDKLSDASGVISTKANLNKQQVQVNVDTNETAAELAARLTPLVFAQGYSLSPEVLAASKKWNEFIYAVPLALVFLIGFVALQKFGLVNLITASQVSYGTALFIGLIASTSSCLAVVGGLVLSLAAVTAKAGGRVRSQVIFHVGRFAGFFLLGGLLGLLGSSFKLSFTTSTILGLLAALVMLVLGLNLLDVFSFTKRLQLSLPKGLARSVAKSTSPSGTISAGLAGVLTFFLPCGFTQSMQLYALSTGSFFAGGVIMLFFTFGTLPVLALLSFGSFSLNNKPWRGAFYKTAGLVVVTLALINLLHSLAVMGLINPIISF